MATLATVHQRSDIDDLFTQARCQTDKWLTRTCLHVFVRPTTTGTLRHVWRLFHLPGVRSLALDLSAINLSVLGTSHLFPLPPTGPSPTLTAVYLRFSYLSEKQVYPLLGWSQLRTLCLDGYVDCPPPSLISLPHLHTLSMLVPGIPSSWGLFPFVGSTLHTIGLEGTNCRRTLEFLTSLLQACTLPMVSTVHMRIHVGDSVTLAEDLCVPPSPGVDSWHITLVVPTVRATWCNANHEMLVRLVTKLVETASTVSADIAAWPANLEPGGVRYTAGPVVSSNSEQMAHLLNCRLFANEMVIGTEHDPL